MSNTVLFLDIDGVCNNSLNEVWFDPFNMQNLKDLCGHLQGPRIVLSSDWRRSPKNLAVARSELLHIGLKIFDTTPIMSFGLRSEEIRLWLSNEQWDRAIILDDMSAENVDPKMDNVFFHRTNYKFGLTEECVDKIVAVFRDKRNQL